MNIWLLTGEYPPAYGGGIATYSYHTAELLRQRGHHITVFATVENLPGGWQVEEPSERLRVVRFGADQSPQSNALGAFARWSYDAALVLAEFCRKEGKPDVLEVQEYLGMPYFTLQRRYLMDEALAKLPVLVTAHTPLYLCRLYDLLPAHRFPGYWIGEMERFSLLAADEVVYPSSYLRKEIEGGLPEIQDHSRVIANPFQAQEESNRGRSNSGRNGFLFDAKLERRKGIEPLLSTFRQMWNAGLDEPLFLVGDDWYDELKEQWMSEAINRRYGKYVEAKLLCWEGKQPPEIVKQRLGEVRAMILPSLFENYPYTVLEAMAAGCPVIVSQSGGHTEMVEDGVSGFIFSHLDAGDLEEKIQTVINLTPDEHDRMAAAAQTRVKQISGYETIAPLKEEALERARKRTQPRKYFPFLRGEQRECQPPEDQTMAEKTGLLSVVIPFFNLGNYLEDTLKSFKNLHDVSFEIIVVDDGSTDQNSLDKLKNLSERYQFRVEKTRNQGCAVARNTGAQRAQGEFLAFLDADDCMDPNLYRQAIKILRQYENVSYVGCWAEYFGESEGYWPTWTPEPPYAMVHNPINTGALVYRRADFLSYGLNDPAIGFIMEDYDSMLSLLENGCRGVAIPEPYFKYRVRSDSMFHTTTDIVKIWTYQQLVHKHQALYSNYAEDILGITNCNGPGYMFDNPTLWYPMVEYNLGPDSPPVSQPIGDDLSHASTKTLLYFAFRSILHKPYTKLRGNLPWLEKFVRMLKDKR
jgi:glycosyltransferase involved in cell wall biosynthesis